MSEPFAEQLSRFTPDASGLDRDALLFAAGRASARAGRFWVLVSALLAATQVLTFMLLWSRPPLPSDEKSSPDLVIIPASDATPRDPSSWTSLQEQVIALDGNLTLSHTEDAMVPNEPPLGVFARIPDSLLH